MMGENSAGFSFFSCLDTRALLPKLSMSTEADFLGKRVDRAKKRKAAERSGGWSRFENALVEGRCGPISVLSKKDE